MSLPDLGAAAERWAPRLHAYVSAMGLANEADDLVQETFLHAQQGLGKYDSRFALSTWLFTISRNLAIKHLRDRKQNTSLDHPQVASVAAPEQQTPKGLWEKAQKILSEQHYQILWFRYGEGLDCDEIAKNLNLSVNNVRVILHRVRQNLAQAWKEELP